MKRKATYLIQSLKEARMRLDLTQAELGQKMGIPQSHVARLETLKIDATLSTLIEMARVLQMEVMLIPKQYVSSVQALIGGQMAEEEEIPAYREDDDDSTLLS